MEKKDLIYYENSLVKDDVVIFNDNTAKIVTKYKPDSHMIYFKFMYFQNFPYLNIFI